MKIAWFHSHFYNWMGGTKFVLEVVKRLQRNVPVEIFVQNGDPEVIRKFTEARITVNNLQVPSTPSPLFWLGFPFFCRRDARNLQTLLDQKNIDTVVTSMFPMNYVASLLKNKRVHQYCYEPFAFFWDPHLRRELPTATRIMTGIFTCLFGRQDIRATQHASNIFTVSKVTQKQIREVYQRNAIITYEGVDTDFFKPQHDEQLTQRYKNDFIVLHCTDFTPIKRTDLTFRIFARLKGKIPAAKLLVTRTCEDLQAQQRLEALAGQLGLRKDADYEFAGFVPHHLLPAYYTLAKILLQTAVNQPQSLPVKEALACQTPVARGVAEEVEFLDTDNLGVIIDPFQIDESAEKIAAFLAQGRFSTTRPREFIKDKFSWDKITDIIFSTVLRQQIQHERPRS